MVDRLPPGLVPSSGSLNFTRDTMPEALQREHALADGRWGVLHVFEGSLRFVELDTSDERVVSAPDLIVIRPRQAHRVILGDVLRCRIDFFREPEGRTAARTPGAFADDAVRDSFERCERNGDFGQVFYETFLGSSPDIAPSFAGTDFERQRRVLRDSVHMMVTRDVSEPQMRIMLERLGEAHGRGGLNVLPRLYELWLDSVCDTARTLDPNWDEGLERQWRVRMRPGMQIIMAGY